MIPDDHWGPRGWAEPTFTVVFQQHSGRFPSGFDGGHPWAKTHTTSNYLIFMIINTIIRKLILRSTHSTWIKTLVAESMERSSHLRPSWWQTVKFHSHCQLLLTNQHLSAPLWYLHSQRRKLRLGELKWLLWGLTTSRRQNKDFNPNLLSWNPLDFFSLSHIVIRGYVHHLVSAPNLKIPCNL